MARWSPSILSAVSSGEGGIQVTWEIDRFFGDSEAPEKVLVDLNGAQFSELDGEETSVDIPLAAIVALGTPVVAISISFWWSGEPPEEKQSSITVPVQTSGSGPGNSGVLPAAQPIVTLVKVQPRTHQTASSITIAWRSNNYNDGNIYWGPEDHPEIFRKNVRPHGEVYHGTFQTDRPLRAAARYRFKVEVRNTLHSPGWLATSIVVRSAADTLSVRRFLEESGLPAASSLSGLAGPGRSLRAMILG